MSQKFKDGTIDWDFCYTPGIIKIFPSILWHKEKMLLELGWLKWSVVFRLK